MKSCCVGRSVVSEVMFMVVVKEHVYHVISQPYSCHCSKQKELVANYATRFFFFLAMERVPITYRVAALRTTELLYKSGIFLFCSRKDYIEACAALDTTSQLATCSPLGNHRKKNRSQFRNRRKVYIRAPDFPHSGLPWQPLCKDCCRNGGWNKQNGDDHTV